MFSGDGLVDGLYGDAVGAGGGLGDGGACVEDEAALDLCLSSCMVEWLGDQLGSHDGGMVGK